jgi:signal peptidase I
MYPTLIIGDRIISNRLAYDIKIPFTNVIVKRLADPQRGDIVIFTSPEDGIRLVKRVIGVPGDVVEMRADRLIVNGVEASYTAVAGNADTPLSPDYDGQQTVLIEQLFGQQHPVILMPERKAFRSFDPVKVPAGKYLVLGDNRDNSMDSRYIGLIKRELLTGQVKRVMFSIDQGSFYLPRIKRFGAPLS